MAQKSKTLICGLVIPISAIDDCSKEHWREVKDIITESLEGTEFKVEVVSDADEVGIIQARIVNNLYDSEIVICDVSCKNPNVMFELGLRLAFDKPTIIIKDNLTNYSFDTALIEHIEYPRDLHYKAIINFKNELKEKVQATYKASKKSGYTTFLKHFGEFKISKLEEKEIPESEFIISMLKTINSKVSRLDAIENMHQRPAKQLNLHGQPITVDTIKKLMLSWLTKFAKLNGMDIEEINNSRENIEAYMNYELAGNYQYDIDKAKVVIGRYYAEVLKIYIQYNVVI